MLDKTEAPLKVAAIGMDERSRNTLEAFFRGPCKIRCLLVEEASAEVALLDMDALHAKELFEKHKKRFPDRPVIVLSLSEQAIEGTIYVRKPMSVDLLLAALEQVRDQLTTPAAQNQEKQPSFKPGCSVSAGNDNNASPSNVVPIGNQNKFNAPRVGYSTATHKAALQLDDKKFKSLIGSAQDIDPYDPEQRAKAYFDPADYLLGRVCKAFEDARQNNMAIRLEESWLTITVFPKQSRVYTELQDSQLRTVCIMPNKPRDTRQSVLKEKLAAQEYAAMDQQQGLQDMDAFLWKLALWTSRGRLPAGTNLSTPVFLRYWPNMSRLLLPPHALRIAALWAHQPHSLLQTTKALKLPQRYVFAFYSAAYALDLAGLCRRSADTLFEPSTTESKNRGVLARILERLKIA
jgi:hypothetical protein